MNSVRVIHVRRLVYERRIPYVKGGRLEASEITAWLDQSPGRPDERGPVSRRQLAADREGCPSAPSDSVSPRW